MRYNKQHLKKMEDILTAVGYVVRYEKGNFQSGYCLVENKKIVIINKFLELDGIIPILLDILDKLEAEVAGLDSTSLQNYHKLKQTQHQQK